MTNAQKIRAMSDADPETDTLIPLERCSQCLLHWLRQPAKEGAR